MKKNNLNKVFTGLLVCMLAVTAFVLKGCKDESEDDSYLIELVVPVYETNNEVGTLFYSESTNSWIIVSDSIIQLPNDTLSERMIIYELIDTGIDEAEREKYNNLIGEKVIFSGEYIGNHPLPAGKTQDYAYLVGYGYYIRRFNHVEISSFKSRSIDTEELIVECGTKSNCPQYGSSVGKKTTVSIISDIGKSMSLWNLQTLNYIQKATAPNQTKRDKKEKNHPNSKKISPFACFYQKSITFASYLTTKRNNFT